MESASRMGREGAGARRGPLALAAALALAALAGAAPAVADLGSATLAIAGAHLTVSPESQTVPVRTATIVETHLAGYDAGAGTLPPGVRVVGELVGPSLPTPLRLETLPGEPFRIPRLTLEGEHRLENIRLVDGEQLLAFAYPRTAALMVTQVLITRVSSRPLTLDEIRAHGIVVDDRSMRAYTFNFGFGVEGDVRDYSVDVLYFYEREVGHMAVPLNSGGSSRVRPPGLAPFRLHLAPPEEGPEPRCPDPMGCMEEALPPIPGVIFFPTDLALLNQFFSVMLMTTNGAPEGDPLVLRDLSARIRLPGGLRTASTEPPTVLGSPVPIRVPGPDGELGTADDLTFLVGQASGQAEFLVEGLKEGTHVVEMDIEGVIDGMPGGVRHLEGKARGAVVVRDPTLGIHVSHPDVVRADEEYDLLLTVSNTGLVPANLVKVSFPIAGLSGCEIVGERTRTIATLLAGESEVLQFRVRPLLTGRVVAAYVRASSQVSPSFELRMGIGDTGIPLSPTSIILPRESELLPPLVRRHALGLVGLGYSLATAPPALLEGRPRTTLGQVDRRVYQFAQAGRYLSLGETEFDGIAALAAEWQGARDGEWEWDLLRRTTQRGAQLGDAFGQVFATEAAAGTAEAMLERWAEVTYDLGAMSAILAEGASSWLTVESRTSGKRLRGSGIDADRLRDLPWGDLYALESGELAVIARTEEEGYRAEVRRREPGSVDLSLVVPRLDGGRDLVRFPAFALTVAGRAVAEFTADGTLLELRIDSDGDGVFESTASGTTGAVAPRPFEPVAAVQNLVADKTGHVVDVLFSREIELPGPTFPEASRFEIDGNLSNGGRPVEFGASLDPDEPAWLDGTRIIRVAFRNALSPYRAHWLTVRDIVSAQGELAVDQELEVQTGAGMPGTTVDGRVIGSDGEPVPFAEVLLAEIDLDTTGLGDTPCIRHVTGGVTADAQGRFTFDYVRQTECGGIFELRGTDPTSGQRGKATGRVRFIGQTVHLDIVLLGRGMVHGQVLDAQGVGVAGAQVLGISPLFQDGGLAYSDESGHYELRDLPVGPIQLSASDGEGGFVAATVEIAGAGAVVERDLVLTRLPDAETGEVRGRVFDANGTEPVFDAWVALYVSGQFVTFQRSGPDGAFDFGTAPAGPAEIEAFEGSTGRSGARVFFTLEPDRINVVDIQLLDERGTLEGHVRRREGASFVPVAGAVVYVSGQPFHTVTDTSGHYLLEGVFAGNTSVVAVDLERQQETQAAVALIGDDFHVVRDLLFEGASTGAVAGEVIGGDGLPLPGALVHLVYPGSNDWNREAVTDGLGRFYFADTPGGTHEVHAIRGDLGAKAYATIDFPGHSPFVTLRLRVGIVRGQTLAEQESGDPVGIRSLVRYRTTIVDRGLVVIDDALHELETDADGRFELPPTIAGPYSIEVFNSFYGHRRIADEIVEHGEVDDHDILFRLAGVIEGTVLDHDGVTPVDGAQVRLFHPLLGQYEMSTDATGEFRFEGVAPDPYCCRIEVQVDDGLYYRAARVGAQITRHGQSVTVEVVLPVQGRVSGRVEQAGGAPVAGAVVTLAGDRYPHQRMQAQTDANGEFSFGNVLQGEIAVGAMDGLGLGGRTATSIDSEGQERHVLVRLEPSGEIEGVVLSPVDGSVVPFAQVQLRRGGALFDAATADDAGQFLFVALPLGTYTAGAFDNASGRAGSSAPTVLDESGERVFAEIVLEARGAVAGELMEPDGTGVGAATVELRSQGLSKRHLFVTTEGDGSFEFVGIPAGDFRLDAREPLGYRRASGEGEIVEEGETVVVDLVLEALVGLIGDVLEPVADSPELYANPVSVEVRQGFRLVGGSTENPYAIDGLIAGQNFWVRASENGGPHRSEVAGRATASDTPQRADLRIWPIGDVRVEVRDMNGVPVPGTELDLRSQSPYNGTGPLPSRRWATAGPDGASTFLDVGVGPVSVFVRDPITQLRGLATGTVVDDGALVSMTATLEPTARLIGRVLRSDGVTPAAGCTARVQIAARTFYVAADELGQFDLPALPLGSYALLLDDAATPGELHLAGALTVPDSTIDLGDLVLDDRDPSVALFLPADGSTAVATDTAVVVQFSEPVDPATAGPSKVVLKPVGGGATAVTRVWSADARTVTLTPVAPLASFRTYAIWVGAGVRDAAGRTMQDPAQAMFTTVDAVAPTPISTLPGAGALDVPVDVQLRVGWSEPLDPDSIFGSAVQLDDLDDGVGVSTTVTLTSQGYELRVTVVGVLTPDHRHRLTVQGVRDLAGNTLITPFVLVFETEDVTPPELGAIAPPAGTTVTAGDLVFASATVQDNQAMGSVRFTLLGDSAVDAIPTAEGIYEAQLVVPPVAEGGDHPLQVEATDAAGNVTVEAVMLHVEPLLDPDAPSVDFRCPSGDTRLAPDTTLQLAVDAADDQGLLKVEFFVGSDPVPVVTLDAPPFVYLLTVPATAVEGDTIEVRAVATDYGLKATQDSIRVDIVEGQVVLGSRTLLATDTTFENQSVVVVGPAVLTIDGPHTLRDLIVLDGARVAHRAASTTADYRLELELGRDLHVACGGAVDVTGLGYLGGARTGGRARGYGNSTAEGANYRTAASHGGRGGLYDGSSRIYGSVVNPETPGGGAGGNGSVAGSAGGGVVRIAAAGRMAIDGAVRADGGANLAPGAAGGSVHLQASAIDGSGSVEADGGPGGGGGRVALVADTLDEGLVARSQAAGGRRTGSGIGAQHQGTAGTVFVRRSDELHGTLILDNDGLASAHWTELPAVGTGLVDAATAVTVTDSDARFRHDLRGIEVGFDGSTADSWPVAAHEHLGSTLTLDVDGHPHPAVVGSSYEGIQRFDRIVVRGAARGFVGDRIETNEPAEVEAGSQWLPGYRPPRLSIEAADVMEPEAGATWLRIRLALDRPASEPVLIGLEPVDLSAVHGLDYELETPSLSIPEGSATVWADVRILSDTETEGEERFQISIASAVGADVDAGQALVRLFDPSTTCVGPNLVLNASNELAPVAGALPGWTTETGSAWVRGSEATAADGSYYFFAGSQQAPVAIAQDVDLNPFAPWIDSGTAEFDFEGSVRSRNVTPYDRAELQLEFLDGAGEPIGAVVSGGILASPLEWRRLGRRLAAPPGTRAARIRLRAIWTFGSQNDGWFDAIALRPIAVPTVTAAPVVIAEGTGGTTATELALVLHCPAAAPHEVSFATADGTATAGLDFLVASGTASLDGATPAAAIPLQIVADLVDELDEQFAVGLASSTAAVVTPLAPITILDDDQATLSVDDLEVVEGTGAPTVTAVRLWTPVPADRPIQVRASTAVGTAGSGDYTSFNAIFTLEPGTTELMLPLSITGDAVDELDETFRVRLQSPVVATITDSEATVTIHDDDDNGFRVNDVGGNEGTTTGGTLTFTVRLATTPVAPATIEFATVDGSAVAGVDYEAAAGTLEFAVGQLTRTVVVNLLPDGDPEPDETFVLLLSNPQGALIDDAEGIGTIRNDDATISIADALRVEGNSGTTSMTFSVSVSPPASQPITVQWATAELDPPAPDSATAGLDFVVASGTLSFTTNSTSRTLTVPIVGDTADEPTERFRVLLSNAAGGTIVDGEAIGSIRDDERPTVTAVEPEAGSTVPGNQAFAVRVTAEDAAGLDRARLSFQGTLVGFDEEPPFEWEVTAPDVTVVTNGNLSALVYDLEGNSRSQDWTIQITPWDPTPPEVAVACPSPGAVALAGRSVRVVGAASDAHGIARVELILDGETEPIAMDTSEPYEFDLPIAVGLPVGSSVGFRLVAVDGQGNWAEAARALTVIEGTVIDTDTTIGIGDLTLDGLPVVVAGASLSFEGPHALASLTVLDGGRVVHPPTDATTERSLELDLAGDLYVACTGMLDATGRGYLGAAIGGNGWTYPNTPTGAGTTRGGSHAGIGGQSSWTGVYGNLFDPATPGGGGGSSTTAPGAGGGGVIRLFAVGQMLIDGAASADGASGAAGGGGGGSVLLSAASISGAGSARARGGDSVGSNGAGGGGRVALLAAMIDAAFADQVDASGGLRPASPARSGSAGTQFMRRDGELWGTLVIDAEGRTSGPSTSLLGVGRGYVSDTGPDWIENEDAANPYTLAGATLRLEEDAERNWPILGNAHLGTQLDLDVTAAPLDAVAGDLYRGIWTLDRVVVRGLAEVWSVDWIESLELIEVEPGSSFYNGNERGPTLDPTKIHLGNGYLGLEIEGEPGAVLGSDGLGHVEILNTRTAATMSLSTDEDGSFAGSVDAQVGDVLELRAWDQGSPYSLPSPWLELPPIVGPIAAPVTLHLEDGPISRSVHSLAATGNLLALVTTRWNCSEDDSCESDVTLLLVDLSAGEDPVVVSETVLLADDQLWYSAALALSTTRAAVGADGWLYLVDITDPALPIHDPATNVLDLGTARWIDITGDRVLVVTQHGDAAASYTVVDTGSFEQPEMELTLDLAAMEIAGVAENLGLTWIGGTTDTPLQAHVLFYDLADPVEPVLLASRTWPRWAGPSGWVDAVVPILVQDNAVLADWRIQTSESRWVETATWHTDDFMFESGHDDDECSSGDWTCWTVPPIEVGARITGAPENSEGERLGFYTFDTSLAEHGLTHDRTLVPPGVDQARALAVANGYLWVAEQDRIVGYPSSLLHPWLDEERVTFTRTATGVRAVGSAGAAELPAGATVSAALAIEGDQASATVATDGSFDVELSGVEVGTPLRLYLVTDGGASGNRVRRRAP